jgi:probable rRNA maturation factor
MIEANNLTQIKVDLNSLRKIAGKVLCGEKQDCTELAVSLVSSAEIKKLNKKYRKKDTATDVLSFTYKDSGEIVLCPQIIKQNAKNFGESFKKELTQVLIHGILHILGYNHEKKESEAVKMEKKTNYYLKLL